MNNVVHVVYVDSGTSVTVVLMRNRDNPVTFAQRAVVPRARPAIAQMLSSRTRLKAWLTSTAG